MKSLARLKDQIKSFVYKMSLNEIDFQRPFGGILKVMLSFFSGVLHGKSADFPAKNVRCSCISSYVTQPNNWSPEEDRMQKFMIEQRREQSKIILHVCAIWSCSTLSAKMTSLPKSYVETHLLVYSNFGLTQQYNIAFFFCNFAKYFGIPSERNRKTWQFSSQLERYW